jgi:hypothetical protein
MRAISLLLLFFSLSNIAFADSDSSGHAGKWFFLWGYNRDFYQNSDISLHGTGANGAPYDFTLHDTAAHDEQSSPSFQLLFPDITIPQTNERIGYYLDETHRINFGVDHMKYVVTQGQTVPISGTNLSGATCPCTSGTQTITPAYMEYEHTDGLNYISLGYETLYPFWQSNSINLSFVQGPDAGIVYPKTNVTMAGAGQLRHDDFNIAGYGAAYKIGLIADIGRSWFLQLDAKEGILNMPWIRIDNNPNDGASQKIQFFEAIMALGYVF